MRAEFSSRPAGERPLSRNDRGTLEPSSPSSRPPPPPHLSPPRSPHPTPPQPSPQPVRESWWGQSVPKQVSRHPQKSRHAGRLARQSPLRFSPTGFSCGPEPWMGVGEGRGGKVRAIHFPRTSLNGFIQMQKAVSADFRASALSTSPTRRPQLPNCREWGRGRGWGEDVGETGRAGPGRGEKTPCPVLPLPTPNTHTHTHTHARARAPFPRPGETALHHFRILGGAWGGAPGGWGRGGPVVVSEATVDSGSPESWMP